ncbi:hypothetical protein ZWY2020_007959, partial [Hordeum vulgare]
MAANVTNRSAVADEIYSELKSMAHIGQGFDEKNIRRRVYDAFSVLIALRVIAEEKKEIRWMGLSNYRYEKLKKLEEVRKELVNKIRHKKALLQEIEKQFDDLHNIKLGNETLQSSAENVNGIRLPFVLVKPIFFHLFSFNTRGCMMTRPAFRAFFSSFLHFPF